MQLRKLYNTKVLAIEIKWILLWTAHDQEQKRNAKYLNDHRQPRHYTQLYDTDHLIFNALVMPYPYLLVKILSQREPYHYFTAIITKWRRWKHCTELCNDALNNYYKTIITSSLVTPCMPQEADVLYISFIDRDSELYW